MGQTMNAQPIELQTAFSTHLGDSMSCPTVTQQGLKLNQDNCAWAKVTGDITEQSSNSANPGYHASGGGIRVGAQRSVGEGWTAGFGAGYGLNYLTSTNFSSNGQFFDLSLSVKKQIEQWTFGVSLGFAQGWFDNNRSLTMLANGAADPISAQFSSKSRMTMAGLRWRAAYEHAIDEDQYLKPYVDVDLVYGYTPGYSEAGSEKLGLNVGSNSRWNVAITPMLEYGLDVVTEDKSRVKLFVSAGASFLPNNTHKNQVSFQGVSSSLGTFDVITDGPEILGRLNLGIQAFHSENVEVRAQYGLLLGDGYLSQSVTANLTWRF
jgi:outer membrane autotransporter protein